MGDALHAIIAGKVAGGGQRSPMQLMSNAEGREGVCDVVQFNI